MSYKDIRYIQIELYDAPDPVDGTNGQVCALLSESDYLYFQPFCPGLLHITLDDAATYYREPFPYDTEDRMVMTHWVRGFEKNYFLTKNILAAA